MKKRYLVQLISSIALGYSLVGCSALVKTPYQAPQINVPQNFAYAKNTQASAMSDQWWTLFQDTQLNQLINQVLSQNNDLVVAGLTIKQARLQAGLAADQQGLRVNSSTTVGHQFDIHNNRNYSQGTSFSTGVSYEVDLFGKLAKQTEAAKWEAQATEEDLEATAQTLVATTANLYWQLAYLHESLTSAQASLINSQKLYDLVNIQYKAGAVSGLEIAQAAQAVQSQKANLSQIQQNLVETRTAIAVLLHIPVQQLNIAEPTQLPEVQLPKIAAGLPAELLARRPDLKASELRLRKVLATADATRASYYPSISLTGSLGTSSTSLSQLIKNPILTLGANLSLPFLQYNDMKKNIAISQIDYEKAIIQYRQSLYQAFADVENALSARTQLDQQVAIQTRNLALAEKAEHLINVQYRYGSVALKNVLDQQQTTRTARLNLLSTKKNQYNAYVTLMQALGGKPI